MVLPISKERKREYNKRYREKNPEATNIWKAKNKDKIKKWKLKNREQILDYHKNYNKGYNKKFRRRIGLELSKKIKERLEKNKCEKCSYDKVVQIHHKKPLSEGGKNDEKNLILLCPNCHAEEHLKLKNEKRERKSSTKRKRNKHGFLEKIN